MPIEFHLCKRLEEILKDLFTEAGIDIEVDGNWLIDDDDGFKDVDSTPDGSKVYITVSPRSYPEYTAKTAEIDVKIEADFRHDDCPDGAKVSACYGRLIDMLDLWHDDFDEMKNALAINHPIPQSPNHPIPQSPNHPITQSPNHPIPQSPNHPITQSPNHPIPQSPNHPMSFDPCGLRLSGGQWDRQYDPLGWSLNQSFTIKGRIKRS